MYQTVTDLDKIRQCQEDLQCILNKKLSDKGEYNVGFPGGSWRGKINFNDKIWYHSSETDSNEKSPRFFNGFGFSKDLSDNKSNSIVVEINIPTTGVNRRVAGFFAKDESGNTCLFHRGRLGGGRKGIDKEALVKRLSHRLNEVIIEGVSEQGLLVGVLNCDTLADDLYYFLVEIFKFKSGED